MALTIAMLVGWIILMAQKLAAAQDIWPNTSLLIAGIVSFVLIVVVLVMFSIFLVRQIYDLRRQSSFVDSVTHELKSPLASLKLLLETLARPELADAQRAQLHQMMADDVERLSTFIDDVLEASRLTHGVRAHVLDSVPLAELVRDVVDTVSKRYKLAEQPVSIMVDENFRVRTDRTAIETALKNLLDNAVKYSDAPIRVSVTARVVRGRAVIEVSDSGIGIAEADLKRVFERFYRVPVEAVRARRGTGLGLYVVASLIQGIGGRLEARSAGIGRGTTMIITLPREANIQ